MATATFEIEQAVYEAHRDGWLSQGLDGCFAVIKGQKIIGVAHSHADAIRLGITQTRSRQFMVHRIRPAGSVEWLSHID